MTTRCMYCGKYTKKDKFLAQCNECRIEFERVKEKLLGKYSGALKGLASK